MRVLVVDDSLFMRAAISKVLTGAGFEVVGQAKDGREGVDKLLELQPDAVTMDFNMPRLNGAQAVREIMDKRPTPVIMVSAHTTEGARETFEALAAGAIDFVTKPSGEVSADMSVVGEELVRKLRGAARARPRRLAVAPAPAPLPTMTWPPGGPRVIVVGVSTGGPAALSRVVPALPGNLPSALVIVQHMPAQFTAALAERLNNQSVACVKHAEAGDVPRPGLVLIAPGDQHLEFEQGGRVRLTDGPAVHGCRPAADVTMIAAARVFGHRASGLVMTGMGKDGAEGIRSIKGVNGTTFAQDEDSSVIYGMPRTAIDTGCVDEILALDQIAGRLAQLR